MLRLDHLQLAGTAAGEPCTEVVLLLGTEVVPLLGHC